MKTKHLIFVLGALAGCDATSEPAPPPATRETPPVTPEALPDMPLDHPDIGGLKVLSKGPRRMSVEQIERSIEQIANVPAGSVRLPENLALTLGRPDYLTVTEEALDPSPLFMKFMMDLGGIICANLRDSDLTRPLEERVYKRYEQPEENLRHLLLVFTGIEGPESAPYVARLWRVYEAGVVGGGTEMSGYEAACLALFTSPEFLLY